MSVKRAFKSLGHEKRREGRKIFLFFPPSRGPPILESPRPSRGSAGSDTDNGMIASIIWFKLKLSIRSAQDSFARHRDPIIQGSLESRAKVLRFASRSGITLGPPCPLEINIVPEFQLARHGRTRSRGHESPRAPGRADRRAREREREGKAGGGGAHLVRALSTKPAGRREDAAPLGRQRSSVHTSHTTPTRAAVNKGLAGSANSPPRDLAAAAAAEETTTAVTRARDVRAGGAGACHHSRPRSFSPTATEPGPPYRRRGRSHDRSALAPAGRIFARQAAAAAARWPCSTVKHG